MESSESAGFKDSLERHAKKVGLGVAGLATVVAACAHGCIISFSPQK